MRILSALLVLIFSATALHAALKIPLTVKDGASAGNITQYPVKVGVPLPMGTYDNTANFRVVDASGNTVPAQFDVLARWWPRNTSIRFVLVQFLTDVNSGSRSRYFLQDDGSGNAATGVQISEDAARYSVNAGKVQFEVKKNSFNIIDRLWYDVNNNGTFETAEEMLKSGQGNGAALTDTLGNVTCDTAKTGLKFTMEESGPVRMVLKVESPTDTAQNGWGFIVRIQAYYNQPFVVLDYYLKNSAYGATGHHLSYSKFALVNNLSSLGSATVRAGGALADNAGAYEAALGSSAVTDVATAWSTYTVNGSVKSGIAAGYVDLSDNVKGMMAVVRKFSYLWPTGLEVTADKKINVNLWPQGSHRMLDETRRSHQVLLYFHPGSATQADLFKQAKIFQQYPVPVLQPTWYAQTHAFSDWGGVGFPSDTTWNEALYNPPTSYAGTGNSLATGWWNWGGSPGRRNSSGGGGWPGYLDDYVSCGSPAYFYHADDVARHTAEMRPMWMDNFQYGTDNRLVKIEYPPACGLRAPNAGLDSTTWTSWDYEHIWIYEILQYYFMSGERFCQDYLKMQADFTMLSNWDLSIADTMKPPYYHDFTRSHGQSIRTAVDAYKATGEERYLKIIKAYAQYFVDNAKSPYGIFCLKPFMSSFISSSGFDIYFLLPENTSEERILKERFLRVLQSAGNGAVYWGGNNTASCPKAWGQAYQYRADSVYVRPTPSGIEGEFYYVSYYMNHLGLSYFLFGDTVYRSLIGRSNPNGAVLNPPQSFMAAPVGSAPANYYRGASAAWYNPEQKKSVMPPRITTLKAVSSHDRVVALQWTSVGGDAYKLCWSNKPIVNKLGRVAPLDSGDIYLPYPDTVKAFTNIYRAIPLDITGKPKTSGQTELFTTATLPDSLIGKKVYFILQAVNIASDVDQCRGAISNLDSIVLDSAKGTFGPADSTVFPRTVRSVYTMNSGELMVVLNNPVTGGSALTWGVALAHAAKGTQLTISSVELDTNCKTLLRIRTSGMVEGQYYRLMLDSAQTPWTFVANFRPNIFSTRKIHFGNNYHGNGWEVGHRWDGDIGYNMVAWDAVSWYDWDPATITDSSTRGCIGLGYSAPYGTEWLKVVVSREVRDYLFSAYVRADSPRKLQVEDTMMWNSRPSAGGVVRTDSIPLLVKDGCVDMVWQHLTNIQVIPVFKYFKSVNFKPIAVEKSSNEGADNSFIVNYPNPFNPETRISFALGRGISLAQAHLVIYDVSGRIVQQFTPAVRSGQVCTVLWNGHSQNGKSVANGIYYARLNAGSKVLIRKLVFMK
ncbi:MAG: T9SS type A sorting domain-containing protein [Fibrobacteres bacterium]|nr:T9SS type A sorting domain-containing protein [Fibrobacterota bacterium]